MPVRTIDSGATPFGPSSVGGTSTSAQMFPALGGNFTASSSNLSTSAVLSCAIPNNGQYEQKRFAVIASGKFFVHGTSPTQVWKMYNGTSLTPTSNTVVLTMSALTGLTTNAWYPWTWASVMQGDSSSGILQVTSSSLWVDNATAGTITLTGATGVAFGGATGLTGSGYSASYALNLCMSFQQTVSDAKNICYCSEFYIEA